MQKIKGKYVAADVFSDTAEEYAIAQIKAISDNEAAKDSKICIMPDVHPGKVGPIGLTMTLENRVLPCLLGADIGCGISYIKIKETKVEYQKLDTVIRDNIPVGSKSRREPHRFSRDFDFDDLICRKHVDKNRSTLGLGTLGSGNHFIELDKDYEGNIYAFVHSGSRYLGAAVSEYYLKEGQKQLRGKGISVPYELTYLEGKLMDDYLHDVREVMGFAMLNREIILYELEKRMKWKVESFGESIHNYVDENRILRKGAASAYEDDEVFIPINMRDGIIIGRGKGNPDWNFSAPHGAGRILNRDEVRKKHTVSEFKETMKGIYSPTVGKETLDEAPFAYRGIDEIVSSISPSVKVEKILKPLYNYKAAEERR
ncbi:MAG: RtcB family protein [Anaerovoracaceae bacterium]